jgi:hypothetical protein
MSWAPTLAGIWTIRRATHFTLVLQPHRRDRLAQVRGLHRVLYRPIERRLLLRLRSRLHRIVRALVEAEEPFAALASSHRASKQAHTFGVRSCAHVFGAKWIPLRAPDQ